MSRFNFGNIVVVEKNLVGVIVKSWGPGSTGELKGKYTHEVYVRSYNGVKEYLESDIRPFIFDKELTEEDMEYQEPAS